MKLSLGLPGAPSTKRPRIEIAVRDVPATSARVCFTVVDRSKFLTGDPDRDISVEIARRESFDIRHHNGKLWWPLSNLPNVLRVAFYDPSTSRLDVHKGANLKALASALPDTMIAIDGVLHAAAPEPIYEIYTPNDNRVAVRVVPNIERKTDSRAVMDCLLYRADQIKDLQKCVQDTWPGTKVYQTAITTYDTNFITADLVTPYLRGNADALLSELPNADNTARKGIVLEIEELEAAVADQTSTYAEIIDPLAAVVRHMVKQKGMDDENSSLAMTLAYTEEALNRALSDLKGGHVPERTGVVSMSPGP